MSDPDTVKRKTFPLIIESVGKAVGKMRNEVDVNIVEPYSKSFEIASDEGVFHGGDETAPSPLSYLAAAHVTCYMTQVRAFAKRLRVPVDDLTVRARMEWEGEQVGRDPYTARSLSFTLETEMITSASEEDQLRLLRAARDGCFVEATISAAHTIAHRSKIGNRWHDV